MLGKDLPDNSYVIIKNAQNEVVDKMVVKDSQLVACRWKTIRNEAIGCVKPRNIQQEFAFNMLQDSDSKVKLLTGRYGSGKSMIMIDQGLDFLSKGKFDRIIYVRNNIAVRDTTELGALPGGQYDKLLPFLMQFADHVGGRIELEKMIENETLEPIHLGFLRGRDLQKSLVYCTEAQNLTRDHIQLLLGRIGEGSELWLDGDFKAQVDKQIFDKSKGLQILIDTLKGNKLFGYVNLVKSERSEVSALADLLDGR